MVFPRQFTRFSTNGSNLTLPCVRSLPKVVHSWPTLLPILWFFPLFFVYQSVKEWWLVSPLGGVFSVLVVEAADPAFRLQIYIEY
jgi:hypothetical protein